MALSFLSRLIKTTYVLYVAYAIKFILSLNLFVVNVFFSGIGSRSGSSRSSKSGTHSVDVSDDQSDDEEDEYQRVSDEMMNVFKHAVAVYRKRQVG